MSYLIAKRHSEEDNGHTHSIGGYELASRIDRSHLDSLELIASDNTSSVRDEVIFWLQDHGLITFDGSMWQLTAHGRAALKDGSVGTPSIKLYQHRGSYRDDKQD